MLIIGIAGGTASGKTELCQRLLEGIKTENGASDGRLLIHLHSFYRPLKSDSPLKYDFDHPSAFDFDLLENILVRLKQGLSVNIPNYCLRTHQVIGTQNFDCPMDVVFVVGILVLYEKKIRDLMDMKVFVDVDSDYRLSKCVQRGTDDLDAILTRWLRYVKPSFDEFVFPTKTFADIIIPRGCENHIAMNLLLHHICDAVNAKLSIRRSATFSPIRK